MLRFRIAGIYLLGVVTILVLAIWGVSLRSAAGARTETPSDGPQESAAVRSSLPNITGSTVSPGAKVSIENFMFVPEVLTVTAGTTVTWVNTDDVPHTASSTSKPSVFDSKGLDTDQKYSFQFTTPGTYEYYCKVHPHMIGRIIVK
jgi:plastocyanin